MGRPCPAPPDPLGGDPLGGDPLGGELLGSFDFGAFDFFFGAAVFFFGSGLFPFLGDLGVSFFLGEAEGALGAGPPPKPPKFRVGINLFLMGAWKLMLTTVSLVACTTFFGAGAGGSGAGAGGGS